MASIADWQRSIIGQTLTWVGTPYGWGDAVKQVAVDCSGLVQGVFSSLGVALPRTSQAQAGTGQAVPSLAQAQPGDLIFFNTGDGANSHVGIYAGNGMMYDAPHQGTTVGLHPIAGYGQITAIRREMPPTDASLTTSGQSQSVDPSWNLVLQTINYTEGSPSYTQAPNQPGGASGRYQIIVDTWNHYGGYSQAYQAPPNVQDQFVVDHLTGIVQQYGVQGIPYYWYTGNPNHAPSWNCSNGKGTECLEYNANGGLQPSQYAAKWMAYYAKTGGSNVTVDPNTGRIIEPGQGGACDGLRIPSVDLKLFSLGGWCIGQNIIRPVVGSVCVAGGGVLMLVGVSLLVKQSAMASQFSDLKKSLGPSGAERADARVRQQREEALQYAERQQEVRSAGAAQREDIRTSGAARRQQQARFIRAQEVAAREQTVTQGQAERQEHRHRVKTGYEINKRITRKQKYDVPSQKEKNVVKAAKKGKQLELNR